MWSRRRGLCSIAAQLACIASALLSRSAAAAGAAPLEWSAPAECPGATRVQASLAALVAPGPLRWERFDVVRGQITRSGAEWQLQLQFISGADARRRSLRARECSDLADAAAVAIVLALTAPEASTELARAPGSSAPSSLTTDRVTTDSPARDAGGASGSLPLSWAFGAEAVLDPSTMGSAAFGAAALVRLQLGRFASALYGVALPAVRSSLGGAEAIDLGLWAGGARGCWLPSASVAACAGAELGRLSGSGVALRAASRSRDLWLAPALSLELSAPLVGGIRLRSSVAGLMPLVRSRFRVDEQEVVHQLPALALRLGMGLELALH